MTGCASCLGTILAAAAMVGMSAQPKPGDTRGCTDAGCHDGYKKSVVHPPVAAGDCDSCHEPADSGNHKFEFVEERDVLCIECHDEPEGKTIHQPTAEGKCTDCHDPHASDHPSLLIAADVKTVCDKCHKDVTEGLTFLHGPVGAGACTICHNPHSADHASLLRNDTQELCVGCHTPLAERIATKPFVHQPVKDDCTACHNPHGADNRANLIDTPPDLCTDCHDGIADIMDESAVQHDALTVGRSCVECHDPHASDVERNLRLEPMDLCLSCHDKTLDSDSGSITNMAKLLKENVDHHGPIRDKNCTGCHLVHGGDHFRMLIEEYPAKFYVPFDEEQYALCFECHEVDMVEDERTDVLTNFRNGDRNLHYLHVNRKTKGRTCRACHETHASKKARHIRESVPFGTWELPLNFAITDTGGSCQPGCHRAYRYDRDTPVVNLPER